MNLLTFVWQLARATLRAVLLAAGPFVRVLLLGIAALTAAMALLFRFSGVAPHLPFWSMLGLAVGLVVLLMLYHALLSLLSE
jgi:hypothetical protein